MDMRTGSCIAIAALMLGACGGGETAAPSAAASQSDAATAPALPAHPVADELCGVPIIGGHTLASAYLYQGDDPLAPCDECSITGEGNVVDGDPDNFASIDFGRSAMYGIGEIIVATQHGIVFPAGNIVGFTLSIPPELLGAAVPTDAAGNGIPQFSIESGLSRGDGPEDWESHDFGRLPAAQVAGLMAHADRFFIGYKATKPFDYVILEARAGGVVVNRHVRVFNACGDAPATGAFPGDPS